MFKHKRILIGIGCLIAFFLIVIAILYFAASGLTSVINKQLSAIRAGDLVKAYAYTSQDFRNATSLRDFENFIDQYQSLKNNKSVTISGREIKNNAASIQGILYAIDGTKTAVDYVLIKEDGEWKIMGIQVNPETIEASTTANNNDTSALINSYDNPDSRYLIKYPGNWEYEKAGDGTVIFSGKRGTPAFLSTVNIQTVLTKKTGGDFSTVKQFMSDIKHQAVTQSPSVKFLDSGPISIKEKNGTEDKGEYTIFTYTYKGKEFKQWQVVALRNDGQVFYAWAYTSPIQQYSEDLDIAKAMLESWVIY